MKYNGFIVEYVIGRKNQFALVHSIFRKTIEETDTRGALINYTEKMNYEISKVASKNTKTLMEILELN